MATTRKPYPTDVSDDEWAFAAPYLTLLREDVTRRVHDLREVSNAVRWVVEAGRPWRLLPHDVPPWEAVHRQARRWLAAGRVEAMAHDPRAVLRPAARRASPTAATLDGRTIPSTPESGSRAGDDGYKRRRGPTVHMAVDAPGPLPAVRVTAASAQGRAQVLDLAADVQAATGQAVTLAFVDPGYTVDQPAADAAAHGIRLEVVELAEAKRGVRAAAPAVGGRAELRVAGPVPPPRPGLRADGGGVGGVALGRVRRIDAQQGDGADRPRFITGSSRVLQKAA